jgi:hypothetical protein
VDYKRAWVGTAILNESEMALFFECAQCAQKPLNTADIVREAMLRQQSLEMAPTPWRSLTCPFQRRKILRQ